MAATDESYKSYFDCTFSCFCTAVRLYLVPQKFKLRIRLVPSTKIRNQTANPRLFLTFERFYCAFVHFGFSYSVFTLIFTVMVTPFCAYIILIYGCHFLECFDILFFFWAMTVLSAYVSWIFVVTWIILIFSFAHFLA